MPDTSMPMKIMLTGIQTLTNFQLSFSTVTTPEKPKRTTITELIKFCKEAYETNEDFIWMAKFLSFIGKIITQEVTRTQLLAWPENIQNRKTSATYNYRTLTS